MPRHFRLVIIPASDPVIDRMTEQTTLKPWVQASFFLSAGRELQAILAKDSPEFDFPHLIETLPIVLLYFDDRGNYHIIDKKSEGFSFCSRSWSKNRHFL